jgi:hypothetical protein
MASLQMMGCASTVEKDANKNLFQQALVLQKVKSAGQANNNQPGNKQSRYQGVSSKDQLTTSDKIEWVFAAPQIQPNVEQKRELFLWFSTLTNFNDNPVLLQLGPDWITSYKRGNVLRTMIPRGILIEQKYDADLPKHKVIFSLKQKNTSLNVKGEL